jgi:hypothetical protein
MARSYMPKDLKKVFPELKSLQDITVVPILALIIDKFLEDVAGDYGKYGISNLKLIQKFTFSAKTKILDDVYVATFNVMMVRIVIPRSDIYMVNGGGLCYVSSGIIFDSGKNDDLANNLFDKFSHFVKSQTLFELKREATRILKEKGQVEHVIHEISEFYLQ